MLKAAFNIKQAKRIGASLAKYVRENISSQDVLRLQGRNYSFLDPLMQTFIKRVSLELGAFKLNPLLKNRLESEFVSNLLSNSISRDVAQYYKKMLSISLSADVQKGFEAKKDPQEVRSIEQITNKLSELRLLLESGKLDEAAEFLRVCVRQFPQSVSFATNFGTVLLQLGKAEEGQSELKRAISLSPSVAAPFLNLASFNFWRGEITVAEELVLKAIELEPSNVKALSLLGSIQIAKGDVKKGAYYLYQGLGIQPESPVALSTLGSMFILKGDTEKAKDHFEKALRSDPTSVEALVGLSSLEKDPARAALIAERIKDMLKPTLALSQRIKLYYTLGNYYDKIHCPPEAFSYYQKANELKKSQTVPYNAEAYSEQVTKTIALYNKETLAVLSPSASQTARPVFIVGMMRSGTSLCEQILASHPECFGAGELEFWNDIFKREPRIVLDELPGDADISAISDSFLKFMDDRAGTAERFVDKTPFNLMYIGLIHKVFPKAKILYMRRDPIDTCLSCYFNDFTNGASFAMDLQSLVHFYQEHLRLAEHWKAVLPADAFMEVPYEGLVQDQEHWSRRILQFIGLEWDGRVLKFHETEREVRTASVLQVREKLYSHAIGRWKPYREFLGPLLSLASSSSTLISSS